MVGVAQEVYSLAGGKVVAEIEGIGLLVHLLKGLTHMVGVAIGGQEVELGHGKPAAEGIDILLAHQLKDIPGLGEGFKGHRIQHTLFDDLMDFSPYKTITHT